MRLYIYIHIIRVYAYLFTRIYLFIHVYTEYLQTILVIIHNPLRGNPQVIGISVPFVMVKSLFFRLFFSNSPTWQLKSSHRPVKSHSNHHEITMKSPFFPGFPDMFGPPTGAPVKIPHWATPTSALRRRLSLGALLLAAFLAAATAAATLLASPYRTGPPVMWRLVYNPI